MKKLQLLILIHVFLSYSPLFAEPLISEYLDGSISGTGFGTKTTAIPVVWDNFDGGTNDSIISGNSKIIGGTWSTVGSPTYSNYIVRKNSTLSTKHDFTDGTTYNLSLIHEETQSEYYFTFWFYYDLINGVYSSNVKPFQALGSNNAFPSAYAGWQYTNWLGANISDASGSMGNNIALNNDEDLSNFEGKWIRIECYLKQSTNDTNDGIYRMTIHDGVSIRDVLVDETAKTRASDDYWSRINIVGAFNTQDSGASEAIIYSDDVYIDDTQARIELGNNSVFENCTHREIQIPTAWSDTSITFTLNQGTFATGSTAYLFVIDENGVASPGYPITVGGSQNVITTPNYKSGQNLTAQRNVSVGDNVTWTGN